MANYHHEHATAVREKMVRSLCAAAAAGCAPVARQCPRSQAAAESSTGCFAWARKAGADRQAIAADDGRWGGARWRGRASPGAAAFVESRPPAWSGAARARAAAGAAPRHRRRRRWRLYPDVSREDFFVLKYFLSSCAAQLLISFVRSKKSCLEKKSSLPSSTNFLSSWRFKSAHLRARTTTNTDT